MTGGSRGLGFAAAQALVADGARVVLSAPHEATASSAAERLAQDAAAADPVAWVVADNADPATPGRLIGAARDRFGRLDGALISVGGSPPGTVATTTEDAWRSAFESVFLGAVRLARILATDLDGTDLDGTDPNGPDLNGPDLNGPDLNGPDLNGPDLNGTDLNGTDLNGPDLNGPDLDGPDLNGGEDGRAGTGSLTGTGGSIVFVLASSVRVPLAELAISNGLFPGLAGVVKTLAGELGPAGIRVNGVLPVRIATDRVRELDALRGDPDEVRARLSEHIPLRRYGEPEEFGRAAAFLLSPAASYITGAMIPVDGGAISSI